MVACSVFILYLVVKTENCQQALDIVEKSGPHLMIINIVMPKIEGY
ncbi:MAG: hypothetical protein MGG11_15235 [Trichodesmium sp. MAG_R03]|nr:hypothetical protein [Trichodesmium sp. MAG_R03]